MIQKPHAISLMLCDRVVFEQGSQKPFLLGIFTGMAVEGFPSGPQTLDVFAALTDGLGDGTIQLSVTELATDEEIYVQTAELRFPDPLRVVNLCLRVRSLWFAVPGEYLFTLSVDGEEIATRRVRVYSST